MSKFTKTIPLVAFEYNYQVEHVKDNQHVYTVVRYSPSYLVEMNSNMRPMKAESYNCVSIRNCEADYKRVPPRTVLLSLTI